MNNGQLKIGAILSYILIVINSFYGIIITPFILSKIGISEYGVYKMISSFSSYLVVLDFGIGSTVMRYVAKFIAENDKKKLENFFAMSMIQSLIVSAVIVIVSVVMYSLIEITFGSSLTEVEIIKAKKLFVLFIANLCLNVFENVIYGIIAGSNEFVFANSMKLLRIFLRILLIYVVISFISDSTVLVGIDILITLFVIIIEFVYIYRKLLIRIKYYFWDKLLFVESLKYTSLVFIQSVIVQFNGNLDNIVIGAVIGSGAVAVYSIGLQLYNMYEQFALSLSNLMLPTVTNQIYSGASNYELENTVIKVGRFQFALLGGALAGFTIIGKEFIYLWLGEQYHDAWVIAMILMVPTTIPLIQNVCLSILRAKNKLMFRTCAVCTMALFNLIVTIVGVKYFGYIAAAVGTAIGLIGANIILMNIYYYCVLKINIIRIFVGVFRRILLCLVISMLVLIIADLFIVGGWIEFIAKVIIFLVVYGTLLMIYGFDKSEKSVFKKN